MSAMPDHGRAKEGVLDWIGCTWTVYVADPAAEPPLELGVRSDLPQFTVAKLSTAFLERVHTILRGKTEFDVAKEHHAGHFEGPTSQVAAATVVPKEFSVHLYVCSDEFCRLLAAIDEHRATDIARRWKALLWPSLYQDEAERQPGQELREATLRQLIDLAREATKQHRKLMVRIEYRRQVKDLATGKVQGYQETRH